jgi:hypothetical protein
MLTPVIAQGTTVMGIELVVVVSTGLSVIVTTRFLVVDQLAALTEVLLTFVATTVIEVPDTEAVAELPFEQLPSHE